MLSLSPHFYYPKNATQNPVKDFVKKFTTLKANTSKLIIEQFKNINALFNDP
jgi:hypothetical protein